MGSAWDGPSHIIAGRAAAAAPIQPPPSGLPGFLLNPPGQQVVDKLELGLDLGKRGEDEPHELLLAVTGGRARGRRQAAGAQGAASRQPVSEHAYDVVLVGASAMARPSVR
jgi:hypothetical protein